ncbi:hypothetical protein LAZ67_18000125 [Cordylochernes scorpioides]|uniref:Reverse transcriptase Ty1/copia-type domain-containing protein n=1 Tax=Cordylochernes scorpioides TaxID=51811 RepID=A0ABY6LHG3_9ARAC|nr:hypothetical protein LAZ67_18000125 [Cordylochernes scorpioides]
MQVINSKWVYSTKKTPSDGIYKRKARLVAVGCNQRYGLDSKESLSPVLKKENLRTIVALVTQQNLIINTYDVKTDYLYEKYTRTRRLSLDKQKRDSSENTTLCHSVIDVDLAFTIPNVGAYSVKIRKHKGVRGYKTDQHEERSHCERQKVAYHGYNTVANLSYAFDDIMYIDLTWFDTAHFPIEVSLKYGIEC